MSARRSSVSPVTVVIAVALVAIPAAALAALFVLLPVLLVQGVMDVDNLAERAVTACRGEPSEACLAETTSTKVARDIASQVDAFIEECGEPEEVDIFEYSGVGYGDGSSADASGSLDGERCSARLELRAVGVDDRWMVDAMRIIRPTSDRPETAKAEPPPPRKPAVAAPPEKPSEPARSMSSKLSDIVGKAMLATPERLDHSLVCLVDANGDGVKDVVGRSQKKNLVAFSGIDGRVVWQREGAEPIAHLWCTSDDDVITQAKGDLLVVQRPKSGTLYKLPKFPAPVRHVSSGAGCFTVVTTANGATHFDADGDVVASCPVVYEQPTSGTITARDWSTVACTRWELGDPASAFSTRKQLVARAVSSWPCGDDWRKKWGSDLPSGWESERIDVIAHGDTVTLLVREQTRVRLAAYATADGRALYAVDHPIVAPSFDLIVDNGRNVVIASDGTLRAFDRKTGAALWTVK